MPTTAINTPPRRSLAGVGLLYVLLIVYSSTVVGPTGPNFVPLDPADAFQRLLATRFEAHGSDQRADWIGNLLMLVPFGFVVTGVVWPPRPMAKVSAALVAVLTCFATITVIKYLQLFFPPRTVTLNYITAQTLGAIIGCACFALWHERVSPAIRHGDPTTGLVVALRLYLAALLVFTLMPLDFALDPTDLRLQIDRLPATIWAPLGGDQALTHRAVVILMGLAAFIPVGMLLTVAGRGVHHARRGLLAIAGFGLLITTGFYLLSTLVISAFPVMSAIIYRTCGIIAGAAMMRWLARQDADQLRHRLRALVPWMVLPYVVCVLAANRLLSAYWMSVHDAVANAHPLGLLPLFDYYIVAKAAAARNIVGHAVLYMPIGVLLWLRYGVTHAAWSFILAASLAFVMELARYFRPGLQGDINAVLVAGLAAFLAARFMPMAWSMIEALGPQSTASARFSRNGSGRNDRDLACDP